MRVYTSGQVARILQNYVSIRGMLIGEVPHATDILYTNDRSLPTKRNRPFGMTKTNMEAWPFFTRPHARTPNDGKKRGRAMEELHVSVLDLEAAWPYIGDDEQHVLLAHYVFGYTLDELVKERKASSKSSMQRLIQRSLDRLAREMDRSHE